MQNKAVYCSASSLNVFRLSTTPIIRSTQNCDYSLRYLPSTWPSLAALEGGSWPVPEAAVTVLCTPDDGCGWHSNHVQWTCRIIHRLLCVAYSWTIINFCNFMFLSTLFPQNLYFVWVFKKNRQFSVIINVFRLVIYITAVTIDRNVEPLVVRKEDGRKQ